MPVNCGSSQEPSARWVSTSQVTPRSTGPVHRPRGGGSFARGEQREQGPPGLRRGARRPVRSMPGPGRTACPLPSRRRRSGELASQRTARRIRPSVGGTPAATARGPPRRCRRHGWRPTVRTTIRPAPVRGSASASPRRARSSRANPSPASISTTWAVTSARGGSITSPKSQNGMRPAERRGCCRRRTRPSPRRRLHAERPALAPFDGRVHARSRRARARRRARMTSAVSSMSG